MKFITLFTLAAVVSGTNPLSGFALLPSTEECDVAVCTEYVGKSLTYEQFETCVADLDSKCTASATMAVTFAEQNPVIGCEAETNCKFNVKAWKDLISDKPASATVEIIGKGQVKTSKADVLEEKHRFTLKYGPLDPKCDNENDNGIAMEHVKDGEKIVGAELDITQILAGTDADDEVAVAIEKGQCEDNDFKLSAAPGYTTKVTAKGKKNAEGALGNLAVSAIVGLIFASTVVA